MKIVFAGTPPFAALALRAILAAGHQVALVLTQPDRTAGRGLAPHVSAVKELALAAGIEIFQPHSLKDPAAQDALRAVGADVFVVAAYGLILPPAVLEIPRLGCLNIHASLLPRWRGAAPIQRAILAGDRQTGVCIMQMDAGLDTGPVLLSESLPIADDDSAARLHDKLATLGARLIVEALGQLPMPLVPQPESGATYARKVEKSEAPLDWRLPAIQLSHQVRAFNPAPGATTSFAGTIIKVWGAHAQAAGRDEPGTIIAAERSGILVACGDGALRLTELQKAGGKRLAAAHFISGSRIRAGAAFGQPNP
jgi:methionyl-tRNA formyltransferase